MLCTIVGAGKGLGAALAYRFAAGGCRVALVARKAETTAETITALTRAGHDVRGFLADAALPASIDAAFQQIRGWGHETDILIFNVAAMIPGKASEITAERVGLEMSANLGGAITCVQNTLPAMRKRQSGTILFTGGGLALEPYPDWASLAAGKAALRAYSIALYKELAQENIHVSVIAICGTIQPGTDFDPDLISNLYWNIHKELPGSYTRERIYLPKGADPYYNDAEGLYQAISNPIVAVGGGA